MIEDSGGGERGADIGVGDIEIYRIAVNALVAPLGDTSSFSLCAKTCPLLIKSLY